MSDTNRAIFLSYASQDAEAARRIAEALRAAGVEVWFDQNELVGGDAWDAKIRKQIKECALLIPIISAATQARTEGYFRLEWRLADQRTHLMAKGRPFLLPVVIDATRDSEAQVPDSFTEVQWTKAPGGEVPPAFAARVNKLLGGPESEGAATRHGFAAPAKNEAAPVPRPASRSWLIPASIGLVAVVAVALWQPWKKTVSAEAAATPVATASTTGPATEAQKLVAQARQIYDNGDELNRENLLLAEEFVQRALALDSAEPAAWELAATLSYQMVWHSIDESPARRETMLRLANRAVALAPDGVAAQLVFANAQLVGRAGIEEAAVALGYYGEVLRSLQRLAEQEPGNWRIQRALGTVYRNLKQTDEAISSLQRAVELSGEDPVASADLVNVYIRRQRYAEAEAVLARALKRHRSGRLLTFDAVVKYRWRGDAAGALKGVDSWPAWLLRENRGVTVAWQAAYLARQPERALSIVGGVSRDYLNDVNFAGPRAVLSARAHELAGNTIAAQADWRLVVQRSDQDLVGNAQNVVALFWKAWALARLGDSAGAQAVATLVRQQMQSVPSNFFKLQTAATLWATVGWTDIALSDLRGLLENPGDEVSLTRAYLELEPAFDSLRGDSRFKEILAIAPAPIATAKVDAISAPSDKSVAVLAFANLSDDRGNEYFSDGISEELLNVLAKVPGLKVTARTSAFYFKGKEVPIPEIAKQLGVAYVIEGSVRKQGDKVRITAQLIKAADGFHMWSENYDRDLKDIFAIQSDVAVRVAAALKIQVLGAGKPGPTKAPAANMAAYNLYHTGRYWWNQRTKIGIETAIQNFSKAIALDPMYAEAYAGLASCYALAPGYTGMPSAIAQPQAQVAATKALELDPTLAEPHAVLGFVKSFEYDWSGAEEEFRRAISLNPNYATAHHWLSNNLFGRGRLDEGLAEILQAAELDPLSLVIKTAVGWASRLSD